MISDEQAKLGQDLAKVLGGLGDFVQRTLGTVPQDLVGYLGGDWLRFRRMENIAQLMARTKERLEEWQTEPPQEPPSLSLTLPILRHAADESREELQDLWARLLAAAIDPAKTNLVRQKFLEIISRMDPLDAVLFIQFKNQTFVDNFVTDSTVTKDEVLLSIDNLEALGLMKFYNSELVKLHLKLDTYKDGCWTSSYLGQKMLQALT